jgi:glutamine amidotransferase
MSIAVIDYGMGNLRSVAKALEHVAPGERVVVTDSAAEIDAAARVVFPGQGAMPDCMRELDARGLREPLLRAAASRPFLGICIGVQMLFESSEEGHVAGLGLLRGAVRRFPEAQMHDEAGLRLKVPHMGWNTVTQRPHALWAGIDDGARFYFVHSYFVDPADQSIVMGSSHYGIPFTAAVGRDNIFAVQFHPEKSQASGLRLLGNFVSWNP